MALGDSRVIVPKRSRFAPCSSPSNRRTPARNSSWQRQGGQSNLKAIHLEAEPGASAAVGWSLKSRQWLPPDVPAVFSPDRLPSLDGLIGNPFLANLDCLDGQRLDHGEHA
jgi:hypothetical protein